MWNIEVRIKFSHWSYKWSFSTICVLSEAEGTLTGVALLYQQSLFCVDQIFTLTRWRVLVGQSSSLAQRQDTGSELICPLNYTYVRRSYTVTQRCFSTMAVNSNPVCFHGFVGSLTSNNQKFKIKMKALKCHTLTKISLFSKQRVWSKGVIAYGYPAFNESERERETERERTERTCMVKSDSNLTSLCCGHWHDYFAGSGLEFKNNLRGVICSLEVIKFGRECFAADRLSSIDRPSLAGSSRFVVAQPWAIRYLSYAL